VGEVPADRFNTERYYDPHKSVRGKSYSKLACVLDHRDFDQSRCPVPPELIDSVDSTHLLMSGVVADALRHAGLDPFALKQKNTAVFVGHAQGSSQLGQLTFGAYVEEAVGLLKQTPGFTDLAPQVQEQVCEQLVAKLRAGLPSQDVDMRHLGCNMVAGTVAKVFGLSGSWLALNSACASSLHAMLMGARALQLGRADMVIVGGASDFKNDSLILFSAAQTLSTDGSRPFDANADGLIMSEGYVALVMKTLKRALADGDPVQAVVRGLGVASDGRGKSLWAPRKEGQMKAMQRAYRSGVDMAGLQYLEAHATSTLVGDATELETLGEVLGPKFPAGKKIPVTSVKANIGHTLECAGVAGVIKTVLCMQRQTFPAAINIRSLNSKIDWPAAPYFIPQSTARWEAPAPGQPRRAAVNAFGIGGLNMHVVLDEFTPSAQELVAKPPVRKPVATEDRAIAVVGMGCVFPGGIGLTKYWDTLLSGHDPKVSPPAERWTQRAIAEHSPEVRGGFITDFAYDWRRHKVPPKQVAEADPLQFMLLEGAEQALNDAGYDRKPLEREKCGVIVGTEFGGDFCDHLEIGLRLPEIQHLLAGLLRERGATEEAIDALSVKFASIVLKKWPSLVDETGSFTSSTLASRITKTLDLAGGAVSIDSGSTSALSGLSVAIDMLLSGDNDIMICASGQRRMGPNSFRSLKNAGVGAALTPHNVLDAAYDGIVPAEGVGVVVLKRLADARRDGDRIHAVIRGLGVAHSANSAAEAMQLAAERSCRMAGVSPDSVTLLEIDTDEQLTAGGEELRALLAIHSGPQRQLPLIVGSATSQLGHLGGAAPMSALIKVSLEIAIGQAAPLVDLQTPHSALEHASSAIQMPRATMKWSGPRTAALASWSKGQAFHLILEPGDPVAPGNQTASATTQPVSKPAQAAKVVPIVSAGAPVICRFGASSPDGLQQLLDNAAADPANAWRQAPSSAFVPADRYRVSIVAESADALARKLQLKSQLQNATARPVLEQQGFYFRQTAELAPRVAFVFPGQGSQYEGMLRELIAASPAAAKKLQEIDGTMARLGFPAFAELAWETPTQLGADVWTTQVAMLLADALMLAALGERSILPDVVLGHSFGEFPALYAAGAWDFETAVRMTRARCEGISAVAVGESGMLATDAPASVVEAIIQAIPGHLYLANLNAPDQTVVGGKRVNLEKLAAALQARSHQARLLSVPAAFHTPLMAGASRLLEEQLKSATLQAPRVQFVSTVTNAAVEDVAQVRRNLGVQLTTPVRYADLIARLAAERPTVFVEVGPQQTFTKLNRRILGAEASVIACDNPKRPGLEPLACVQALLECLGVYDARACPAAAHAPAPVVTAQSQLSALPQENRQNSMHDQIPHFDATERRRAKMRDGSAGKSPARPTGERAPAAPTNRIPPATPARTPSVQPATPQRPAARVQPVNAPAPSVMPRGNGVAPTVRPASNGSVAASPSRTAQQPPAVQLTVAPPVTPKAVIAPVVSAQPTAESGPTVTSKVPTEELAKFLVNFVVEQTGYPPEVVELDADLEADLGIDSIKKAQLFGELQEYFDIGDGASASNLSLDDFPTLRHVLNFLAQSAATGAAEAAAAPVAEARSVAPVAQPAVVSQLAPFARVTPAPTIPAPVVTPLAASVSTTPASTAPTNPAELESFLINFVVEQTGYPAEVVDLDADLEADLGIDSIKKAQLFGELQEYFDIGVGATTANLSLDDFPTLRHVLNFLAQAAPAAPVETATATTAAPVATPIAVQAAAAPVNAASVVAAPLVADSPPATAQPSDAPAAFADTAELESFLINFVVEQTGYPAEVVELDADLEADLGIDSIKKAQLFGELQEYFDIGEGASATNLSLDDFPTLRHVVNFLSTASKSSATAETAVAEVAVGSQGIQHVSATAEPAPSVAIPTSTAPAPASKDASQDAAELESFLINFVVEQTGYPAEVVELDADLEADLGIDSIKKAQLFGELQEYFDIGDGASASNLSLDDFPTLRHVLHFLAQIGTATAPTIAVSAALIPANGYSENADAEYLSNGHGANGHATNGHVGNGYAANRHATNGVNTNGHATVEQAPQIASGTTTVAVEVTAETPYLFGYSLGQTHAAEIRWTLRNCVQSVETPIVTGQPLAATAQRAQLSADALDQLQGIADAVEVPLASLLAHHTAVSACWNAASPAASAKIATHNGHAATGGAHYTNGHAATKRSQAADPTPPGMPSPAITTRFAFEMRKATRSGSTMAPTWTGAAVVVGTDAVATALCERLAQAGVVVHALSLDTGVDSALAGLEQICQQSPAPHLFFTTNHDGLSGDWWDGERWEPRRQETMLAPLLICQKWVQLATAGGWLERATLVATTQLGGDFGFSHGAESATGGALAGLLKAIFVEYTVMQGLTNLRVKVIDAPPEADPVDLTEQIFGELGSSAIDDEVAFVGGERFVPFAVERPLDLSRGSDIRRGGVWIVTGGARGITAACAMELGRRYGLKLHLLGASPAPQIDQAWRGLDAAGRDQLKTSVMISARQAGQQAAKAWERVRKDLEIDQTLQSFAAAGIDAMYHQCDVSDRQELSELLEQIRQTSGPIEGVLHGAGIDRSCRFDRKQRDVVEQTIGAKVDGAAHLMALTRRDPIRHFIGFGSISGRLGSFGQADYCLANDMLCKLIGAYRRERPWIHAVGFHWHPWDEVGMAARPETKSTLQGKEMSLMPLAEGMAHFVGELCAGCPEPEVMITERRHWQRFAEGLAQFVVNSSGPAAASPTNRAAPAQKVPTQTVESPAENVDLKTERCRLQPIAAPLPNAEQSLALDSPVWIVGDNSAAVELAARLQAGGIVAHQISGRGDPEQTLAALDQLWASAPAKQFFLMTGRDLAPADLLSAASSRQCRDQGVLFPFLLTQRWYKLLASQPELGTGTMLAAVSLGGDFGFGGAAPSPAGGGVTGLFKSVHIEDSRRDASRARVKVIDAPADEPDESLVDSILRELAADEPEVEVCWSQNQRSVIRPLPTAIDVRKVQPIPRGGVWVVTGGARGITAIAARELARRYDWKLHLVGKSPAPEANAAWRNFSDAEMKSLKTSTTRQAVSEGRSPSAAWDRVTKDVEIFNNLRQFADAGVSATYHACDIGDRDALSAVLDKVRQQDGPIQGVLHGAGLIDQSRFENKRADVLATLIGAKFEGALNLMALTKQDPLAFFVGFGSISGRFGGNGLADYAAGNDGMAKLIDWFRARRPKCASATIHWESWEGSGMATQPRFAWGPKSVMNMKYMLPEEGVRRLEQELAARFPNAEVLYTFGDFYPMFYPREQQPLGEFVPAALAGGTTGQDASATAPALPLLQNARKEQQGAIADLPLDPAAERFLQEHLLRGKPLLPAVVGLEALAEIARVASDRAVVGFDNVQMLDGFLFHSQNAATAQTRAVQRPDGSYACALTNDFRNRSGGLIQKDRPYLRADARVGDRPATSAPSLPAVPSEWAEFVYLDDSAIWHGPVFRCIRGVNCDRQGGWGRILALPLSDLTGVGRVAEWTVPSCVLDAALYTCGIHLWMHCAGAISLPKAIDHLQLGRAARDGEMCLVHFVCRELSSDTACYDFTLVGEDGQLIAAAQGYRKVILSQGGAK